MRLRSIQLVALAGGLLAGCSSSKPFIALGPKSTTSPVLVATAPTTAPMVVETSPVTAPAVVETAPITAPVVSETPPATAPTVVVATPPATAPAIAPVATSELGTVSSIPGLTPKPKPFIAIPKPLQISGAKPSTLLLEHASPDSPVPLSDYAKQPEYSVGAFNLRTALSAKEVQRLMGPPAQLADAEDPWLVYRLNGNQEIWLHFIGPLQAELDAADVIRGAEDGYVRTRVFSADDAK